MLATRAPLSVPTVPTCLARPQSQARIQTSPSNGQYVPYVAATREQSYLYYCLAIAGSGRRTDKHLPRA